MRSMTAAVLASVVLLYLVTLVVSPLTLRIWVVGATLGLPGVFWFGFRLGKTEERGFLAGFDQKLDKLWDLRGRQNSSSPMGYPAEPARYRLLRDEGTDIIDVS